MKGYAGAAGTPAGADASAQPPLPGATPNAAAGAGATPAAGASADPNDPAAQYEAYRAYWYVLSMHLDNDSADPVYSWQGCIWIRRQ